MKTSVFLAAGLLMASVALGQNKKEIEKVNVEAPYYKTELDKSVNDFLNRSIEYPYELKKSGAEGTEVIQFVVTPQGNVTDFKIINSVSPGIDEYVIQTLSATNGKWNPGKVDNKPAYMEKEISVAFYVHSENDLVNRAKIYQQKANALLFEKDNPKKALKYYNQGIMFLPHEESLWAARSLCKLKLGDIKGAQNDWDRLAELAKRNGTEPDEYLANYDDLKDYSNKMNSTLMNDGTK